MYYDKKKYEELIAESPLFLLDKETETTAYKRESYKMVEYLYSYLMAVNEFEYEKYGYEIMEVATRCIGNYDRNKGVFLHYFNAAWKQEHSHLLGNKVIEDKFRGIRITEEEKRNIRKYLKIVERNETACTETELYKRISEAMQLPYEKVRLIAEMSNIRVFGDTKPNADGEDLGVWDQISDGKSFEKELEEAESIEEVLIQIETAFIGLQNRQKPIVSDMITARIWSLLSTHQGDQYSFVSPVIIEECLRTGQAPSQRTIAAKYGRDEASISRSIREFLKKLKSVINEV